MQALLAPIQQFLACPTPPEWLSEAARPERLPVLLIDHANCELKAAQTAMWLIRKYAVDDVNGKALLDWLQPYEDFVYRRSALDFAILNKGLKRQITARKELSYGSELVDKMVLLIQEELHHFQQVLDILQAREIVYQPYSAGRYAKGLMTHVRTYEPATMIDKLICGAYIEARSCERFAALIPLVDEDLGKFYMSLLRSEARHYQDYLSLAKTIAAQAYQDSGKTEYSQAAIDARITEFAQIEGQLISSEDNEFHFHSGPTKH